MDNNANLYNPLYEVIASYFDLEELKNLCIDLQVEFENLPGEATRIGRARELVRLMERQERTADLLTRLQMLRPQVEWQNYLPAEPEAISPYKGLRFFDEADAPLFFGRERATAELIDHLRQYSFLAVVGASGSGKSSLVRAGVVPAVRRGQIVVGQTNSANWSIHTITPGNEPLKALAATLTRDSESVTATKTLLADLQADSDSLDLFLVRQLSDQPDGRLLLIVDQFEELFTQCDDRAARQLFVENLVTAVSGEQQRFSLILALRADFYAFAVQIERLRPLLETRQKIIGAMTPEELRQAIAGPAEQGNWALQPGLVETMLQDVGREPGALPLLSHALQETWARREGRTLTLAGYQAAGGVRKAIAQTADAVYEGLTLEQQQIARSIFLRLTELGEGTEDTRRRVLLSELLPEGEDDMAVHDVLDLLARRRLVTLDEETAQPQAEVAHEALIREWPRLRGWLDEGRAGLRIHRQLTEAARAWQAQDEDESYLYRGGRLAQAQEWATASQPRLNVLEQQFLSASQTAVERETAEREAQRKRELDQARQLAKAQAQRAKTVRQALVGVSVFLVVTITAAVFGLAQSRIAATREAEAVTQFQIAQSQALASASLAVRETNPIRALLLATAAGQTEATALAYDTLRAIIHRLALPRHTWQHEDLVYGSTWDKNGSFVLTWSADGTARRWDVASGARPIRFSHDDSVWGAAWNRDESLILTWSSDKTARLWDTNSGDERLRLSHDDRVNGAAWNRDESLILTWSSDKTARIWDTNSGTEWLRLSHDDRVTGATWNENESLVLTWSAEGTARLWDVASGAERLRFRHASSVAGAAWNGDESLILTWSMDGTSRIWDAISGTERLRLSHDDRVNGATWNVNESLILTWGSDNTARLWDATDGTERLRLSHDDRVNGATWNVDESLILTWSSDKTARIWDAASGTQRLRLSHDSSVLGAAWNGDESLILTWSMDNTARVWDSVSGAEQLRLSHYGPVIGAAWNGDESLILTWSFDNTARIWDVADGAERLHLSHDGRVRGAVWNADESLIVTWSGGTAQLWDATSGSERLRLSHEDLVEGAAWNGDESLILTWSRDNTARVWDAANGSERLRLSHDDRVNGATWSVNESLILTWSVDLTARIWDAASGTEQLRLNHDGLGVVLGAVWNGDESLILTWGFDNTARIWDAASGAERLRLSHDGLVVGAAWNGDESLILTLSGTARVWDAASGAEQLRLRHDGSVIGAAWNGDESLILTWSIDGTARLWDANSGASRLRLSHDGSVRGAAWNGNESLILTWSDDNTVQVWEAATGNPVFTLTGDGSPVRTTQWSQADRRILMVTEAGFVSVHYTRMADLLDAACQRAMRNLTWQEWQLYFPGQPYRLICPQWPAHPSIPEGERS